MGVWGGGWKSLERDFLISLSNVVVFGRVKESCWEKKRITF
jgi:hypothetical protein